MSENLDTSFKQLNLSLDNVEGSMGDVKNSFLEIKDSCNKTRDSITSLGSSITNSYSQIQGSLSSSISSFKNFGANTMNNIQNVKSSFGSLQNVVDDNAVANYAYQSGIATTGEKLNFLQQKQAQLGMVFSSGEHIVGGFSNTFADLQNQWTSAKETYSTLQNSIVNIKNSYSNLRSNLLTVKEGLLSFKGAIGSTAKKSLDLAKNLSGSVLKGISSFGSSIVGAVTTAFPALLSGLGSAIASTWAFTAALLANPITWIVVGIVALGGAIFLLWKNWDKVTSWLSSKWEGFINFIKVGIDWCKGIFSTIFDSLPSFPDLIGMAKEKIFKLVNFIKSSPLELFRFVFPVVNIPDIFNKIYSSASNWLAEKAGFKLPGFQLPTFSDLIAKMKEKISFIGDFISTFQFQFPSFGLPSLDEIINKFKSWIVALKERLAQIDFGSILGSALTGAKNMILGPLKGLASKIMNFLPQSPAKEGPLSNLDRVGPGLVDTISTGIDKNRNKVDNSLTKMWSNGQMDMESTDLTNQSLRLNKQQHSTNQEQSVGGNGSLKQVFNINVSGNHSKPQEIAVAIRDELEKYFKEEATRSLTKQFRLNATTIA